ncbi:MAG: hypothetical protein BWY04_01376 [candidate division CPR1 bacterium ADurb.Bin160]|uniref:Uncharacterized protein n=1 Tax=candidate division CPR1 bacterium ADurb.Bin160 TaxID=1852826 RepID=A0A1V5ZK37_9BACT|nr:MAG: hypothetical protein BWY04_01376 [candidate division CPR1 bacterium ADurb.Bin160]
MIICEGCGSVIEKSFYPYCGRPRPKKLFADEFGIFDENDNERPRPIKIKPGQSQESFLEECVERWADLQKLKREMKPIKIKKNQKKQNI